MPQVINTVTKAAPTDNYPVVFDTDLSGSYRIVSNLTVRDAIVSTQRKEGMLVFVISNLHFYQLQSDLLTWTDLGLSLGGGFAPPIVRYVYLVADASDAARMGGTPNNTYLTFQTAYDAANTLQVALGGSAVVVIKVGSIGSVAAGAVNLTASFNPRVQLVGLGIEASFLGNITVTGAAFSITLTISNLRIGSLSSEGGITLSAINCQTNLLTASSATGVSGAITLNNCSNVTTGSLINSSSLGNSGTVVISSCSNMRIAAINSSNTSISASFNIGLFSITNSSNIIITSYTANLSFTGGTGVIAGMSIPNNNSNIQIGAVSFKTSNSSTASDGFITSINVNNTTFTGTFQVNATSVSNVFGGGILTFIANNCIFLNRTRIIQQVLTPITTPTFRIFNCIFKSTSVAGLSVGILNVTYSQFSIENTICDDTTIGISIAVDANSQVPIIGDTNSVLISSVTLKSLFIELNDLFTVNSVDDVLITSSIIDSVSFTVTDGDINFRMVDSSVIYTSDFGTINGTIPITKANKIINSSINSNANTFTAVATLMTFDLKNSYFGFVNGASPVSLQFGKVYNSYIENSSPPASPVVTYTGTLFTSTLTRLSTDNVVGVVLNNSYDESI